MADDPVKFGRVLEENRADRRVWLVIVPAVAGVIALGVVGIYGISQANTVKDDVAAARARADELQKAVDQRDALLVAARSDESLLRSAGQATAIFYGIDPRAVESGIAVAVPGERAAKVILYGLQSPPSGQRYTVAARGADGALSALRDVAVDSDGAAFVLARNVPEGTTALELVLREASLGAAGGAPPEGARTSAAPKAGAEGAPKAGQEGEQASAAVEPGALPAISLEGATPRIAARFPQADDRGILTQPPPVQARRGSTANR